MQFIKKGDVEKDEEKGNKWKSGNFHQDDFLEKYSSITILIPARSKKLSRLPKPKYRKTTNSVIARADINPLLEFMNTMERVKKTAKRIATKNKGIAPFSWGSIK